jgi:hypothetical protein
MALKNAGLRMGKEEKEERERDLNVLQFNSLMSRK